MWTAGYSPRKQKGQVKRRGNKGGRDRRRQKEIIGSIFFPRSCSHTALLSFFFFDPFSSNLCLMGRQLTGSKSRVPPPHLSTLLSVFAIWDKHHLQPGNHLGTPGKWTEATQMLISPWHPSDMHHTPPLPSRSLSFFTLSALSLWNLIEDSKAGVEVD